MLCGRHAHAPRRCPCGVRPAPSLRPTRRLLSAASATAEETESLELAPIARIEGTVRLPGSKSLSNRILLTSALASGETRVENLLRSDDIHYMLAALKDLGVSMDDDGTSETVVVRGCDGRFAREGGAAGAAPLELYLGNAGTAMRPLTAAVAAAGRGTFVLDGNPRMRERPIEDLVVGLRQLGVDCECTLGTGCPPVRLNAQGLPSGEVELSGGISSQFLTAVLMASPLTVGEGVRIRIKGGDLVSVPYVAMTAKLMQRYGVTVEHDASYCDLWVPGGQGYASPGTMFVEGDASSASYFLGGATITGGEVTVEGCGSQSLQGDVRFASVMEQMGAKVTWHDNKIQIVGPPKGKLRGIDVDCNDIPDAAMTLAVVALFAEGPTAIRNVYNWRLKETERMVAVCTELRKLGAEVEEGHDYCVIVPPAGGKITPHVSVDTYDDHRMAMAFSLAACGDVPVTINDPGCTRKTFPEYFKFLESVTQLK